MRIGHTEAPPLALPTSAELAQAPLPAPPGPTQSPPDPDKLLARAQALVASAPRARYDLATRAGTLGPGVEPAFRFVRDQIRFEAYPGVLRGATGTYVTRAGNAPDRAVLLTELLRRTGVPTRFVLGRLGRSDAERLFVRIFDAAPALEPGAGAATSPSSPDAQAFQARLRARAFRDYATIRKALGAALPSAPSPPRDQVLREIEEHVWVQAEVNSRWVDLDTAFPDATPGRVYATPGQTVDVLPAEIHQRITMRVATETLVGSSLSGQTVLEFSAPAYALLDRQIFLTHVPGSGGGLAGALAGATAGSDTWTPVLWVDGVFHGGKPVAFHDQPATAVRGGPPRGGLGGMFGSGGALSGSSSQLVAEWLEFEIAFPGGRREVTRRALVDRAGIAGRRAGAPDVTALRPLGRDADGPTEPRAVHNIWFSAGLHDLGHYAAALRVLARWTKEVSAQGPTGASGGATPPPPAEPSFGVQMWPFAMVNFALLVQADHTVIPALNDTSTHRLYADSPRILLVTAGRNPRTGGAYIHYDLRRDRLRGLARDTSGDVGIAERKIWFGVLEGALEHELSTQYVAAMMGDTSRVTSTSSLLTGEGALLVRPGEGVPPGVDQETAARANQALTSPAFLVIPRSVLRGGAPGWWEIATSGADTRAVLGQDTNAAMGDVPPFKPNWGWRPYGWGPKGAPPPGGVPTWAPQSEGPIEQIGPLMPDGSKNPQCRAVGNEYVSVSGCVSTSASAVPATTYAPILIYGALALGAVVVAVLGYVIGSGL